MADPWWTASDEVQAAERERARALEQERRMKRLHELIWVIRNSNNIHEAAALADTIVGLEERVQRLEGESYARTL